MDRSGQTHLMMRMMMMLRMMRMMGMRMMGIMRMMGMMRTIVKMTGTLDKEEEDGDNDDKDE